MVDGADVLEEVVAGVIVPVVGKVVESLEAVDVSVVDRMSVVVDC